MICDEDTDCIHGHCSAQFRCSGENRLMDNDCLCFFNAECHSGRCEGVRPSVCEAKLGEGSYCSESSDCVSNQCTWSFHCAAAPTSPNVAAMEISDAGAMLIDEARYDHQVSSFLRSMRNYILCFFVTMVGGMVYRWSSMRRLRNGYDQIPVSVTV